MKRFVFIFSLVFIGTIALANDYCLSDNPDNPTLIETANEPSKTHFENKTNIVFASKAALIISEVITSEKHQMISKMLGNTSPESGFSGIISGFKTGLSIWDSAESINNNNQVSTPLENMNQIRLSVGKTIYGVGLKLKF